MYHFQFKTEGFAEAVRVFCIVFGWVHSYSELQVISPY